MERTREKKALAAAHYATKRAHQLLGCAQQSNPLAEVAWVCLCCCILSLKGFQHRVFGGLLRCLHRARATSTLLKCATAGSALCNMHSDHLIRPPQVDQHMIALLDSQMGAMMHTHQAEGLLKLVTQQLRASGRPVANQMERWKVQQVVLWGPQLGPLFGDLWAPRPPSLASKCADQPQPKVKITNAGVGN